jgi:arylsulfatase A-like enzyme
LSVRRGGLALAFALLGLAAGLLACREPGARPQSLLLVVLDTTRVDAVSAYGEVKGTTPTVDALAAAGLRFTRAYANASWTLPSHATLFTGLLPSQHGVGWTHMEASESLVMLAERLRDAGYETVGVSENPYLRESVNMTQGFEHFAEVEESSDAIDRVLADWRRERRSDRPFFLFVNVMDAHTPYTVRPTNPFLPEGTTAAGARQVPQKGLHYQCMTSRSRELAVLRGLYHGDVAGADSKLADVLGHLREAGLADDMITVIASDHGEHLGEHRLVFHDVGLREPLIRVPLVVHGLRGVDAAVIDAPVQLADLVPSVLSWLNLPAPEGLPGRPFPTKSGPNTETRPIISEHDNGRLPTSEDEAPSPTAKYRRDFMRKLLGACGPDDRVFGEMRSVVRPPWKLIWYADYPPQLYDVEQDPLEEHDTAAERPEIVAELVAVLEQGLGAATTIDGTGREPGSLDDDLLERLRELGYLE